VVPELAVFVGMAAISAFQASRIYTPKGRRLSRDALPHNHRHREWQRPTAGCGTMGREKANEWLFSGIPPKR
jgi:hypothetical protein